MRGARTAHMSWFHNARHAAAHRRIRGARRNAFPPPQKNSLSPFAPCYLCYLFFMTGALKSLRASSSLQASLRAWARTRRCFPGLARAGRNPTARPHASFGRPSSRSSPTRAWSLSLRAETLTRRCYRRRLWRIHGSQPDPGPRSISSCPAGWLDRAIIPRLRFRDDHAGRLPTLKANSLERLCASFQRALAQGIWAVAPENDGKHGHPLLVSRELIAQFLDAPATGNARDVLHAHAQRVAYVSVPESLEKAGLNTRKIMMRSRKSSAARAEPSRKSFSTPPPTCRSPGGLRVSTLRAARRRAHHSSCSVFLASLTVFPLTSSVSADPHAIAATQSLRLEANLRDPSRRNLT